MASKKPSVTFIGRLVIASTFIFCFVFVASASTVIFSDGFESEFSSWSSSDSKWDTSGGNVHSGSKRGEVKGNTEPDDDILVKNISTAGKERMVLEFWYRIKESLEDEDHLYVEWTADGSSWDILKDFTAVSSSTIWESYSTPLPFEANDNAYLAIRFRAHLGAVTSDIFYLDDIVVSADLIQGESTPTPSLEVSPTSTPIPTSIPSATPVPPTPSTDSSNPSSGPKVSGQVTPTPISTSFPSPEPTMIAEIPKPTVVNSVTPIAAASSNVEKQDQDLASDFTPPATAGTKEDFNTPSQPTNLSASVSNFFNNSKLFWLMGIMILAVVLSISKFKNN